MQEPPATLGTWVLAKSVGGCLIKGCLIKGCLNSTEIPKVGFQVGIPKPGIPKSGIPNLVARAIRNAIRANRFARITSQLKPQFL